MKKRILFLACDLSGYFMACLKQLSQPGDLELHVVHYPGDAHAPFRFGDSAGPARFHVKSEFTSAGLSELADRIDPDLVFCSGWADKDYMRLCRQRRNKSRRVIVFDNPWQNKIRQRLAVWTAPRYLRHHFEACWVSGKPQREYARRLGFGENTISEGSYSCDYPYFSAAGREALAAKAGGFPKRFLYVGRYIRIKGVEELWEGFSEFDRDNERGWELWCAGRGDLHSRLPHLERVRDFGFVQPGELGRFIREAGVFVMPSHDDHWGVAIHEFAAAGFPLICSEGAIAATAYLEEGYNGTGHLPGNAASVAAAFKRISVLSDAELLTMGKNSTNLAGQMTPVIWSSIARQYLSGSLPVFRFHKGEAIQHAAATK